MRVTCARLPPEPCSSEPAAPQPDDYKALANAAYARGDLTSAAGLYTLALHATGPCATLYGNRSAAHAALEQPVRALADAMLMRYHACEERLQLKASYRFARALIALGLKRDALLACEDALALEPDHPQLVGLAGVCTQEKPGQSGLVEGIDPPPGRHVALRLKVGRGAVVEVTAPCLHGEALMLFISELARVEDAARLRVVLKGRLLTASNIVSELERAAERAQPVLLQVVGSPQQNLGPTDCRSREIDARLGLP